MASKKIACECGLQILLEWQRARSSVLYSVTCSEYSTVHEFMAIPPIGVHRMGATGNWRLVETIGETP